ncbi:MAG: hypothetical protein LC799_11320 [Actinobacteria bacterium]|nr:hypothetical protein [Actinomycetota bacterium]
MTYTMLAERGATTAPARTRLVPGRGATNNQGIILEVPADQLYYWKWAWQVNEQLAIAELARGEGREFENAADAAR